MAKVLIVDDKAIFRDPIAASLRLVGHETLCAANGKEALALARAQRPGLILLDVGMPEMDGVAVLRSLRSDPATAAIKVIILTAMAERKMVVQAAALGARDYLLKSQFSVAGLIERVERHLASSKGAPAAAPAGQTQSAARPTGKPAATPSAPAACVAAAPPQPSAAAGRPSAPNDIPQLLTRDQCLSRVRTMMEAKTLSGVVAQVISLSASPRSDMSDLATLIGRDSILSARLLQAANSAAYVSSRGCVTTIPNAIRTIGVAAVRNIAAAVGIFSAMPEVGPDGFNPIRCWQHSFAVARLTEQLCAMQHPDHAGTAYLAGLCHDLGEIVFRTQFGAELRQLLELQTLTGRRRDDLERCMLGMTHGELVSTMLQCMGLPDAIRKPVEAMHAALAGRPTGSDETIARMLMLAEMYANGMLLAASPLSAVSAWTAAECKAAAGALHPACPDAVMFRSEILCLTGTLARLSPQEESELYQAAYPPSELKVWLARDKGMSSFDPIHAFLTATSSPQAHSKLPSPAESEGIDALVVLARSDTVAGFTQMEIEAARAAAGKNLPVLWLVLEAAAGAGMAGFVPVRLPTSLTTLGEFIQSAVSSPAREAA